MELLSFLCVKDKIKTLEIELDEERSGVELLNDRISRSRDQVPSESTSRVRINALIRATSLSEHHLFPPSFVPGGPAPLRADAGAFRETRPGNGQERTRETGALP